MLVNKFLLIGTTTSIPDEVTYQYVQLFENKMIKVVQMKCKNLLVLESVICTLIGVFLTAIEI